METYQVEFHLLFRWMRGKLGICYLINDAGVHRVGWTGWQQENECAGSGDRSMAILRNKM